MALEGIDDEAIARGIKFLEDSLFNTHIERKAYLSDVPATLPGFNMASAPAVPHYRVTVNPAILFKQNKTA